MSVNKNKKRHRTRRRSGRNNMVWLKLGGDFVLLLVGQPFVRLRSKEAVDHPAGATVGADL